MQQSIPIGFIGSGVMGSSMAARLLAAGHRLRLFARRPVQAAALFDRGAEPAESPAELAATCPVVFTIVGFPADVEEIYLGPQGLLTSLQPDGIVVDMTTSSPDLARRIARAASERGGFALDAPVSGGDRGAREGTLSIMVGGEEKAFERVRPLLAEMGKTIVRHGPAGAGQHCKLCNQIAIAANMIGVCEALAYARAAGLDPHQVLASIASGAAGSWSLSHLAPRMLAGDFAPGFYVKHFVKDLRLALESATELGLDLPGLALAHRLYRELEAAGLADRGTQALMLHPTMNVRGSHG